MRPLALVVALAIASGYGLAQAGTISPCSADCTWSIQSDGVQVASGQFVVNPDTGDIDLQAPVTVKLGSGNWVGISNLYGNSDPVLGFSLAAGTGTKGKTYSVTLSLPIELSGLLEASSSVSYSLTALSSAGAQITPLNGHLVVAQEVDTDVGGLPPLNKGVDVGDLFAVSGGPVIANSPVYAASNTLTGNLAYDLMSVTIGFALSPKSNVAISGFVQQSETTPVPLPAAGWLLGSALLGLLPWVKRRERLQ
jgi:hypothetical protein